MLHYQTVSPDLHSALIKLMEEPYFEKFLLVGGTALSLQLGHRQSVDIDFFSDQNYGEIEFPELEEVLKSNFAFVQSSFGNDLGFGCSWLVGQNLDAAIKLDTFYTDPFVYPPLIVDGIRMASQKEIIAMKLEAISNAKRKKDFWDLHEILESQDLKECLNFYTARYPYSYSVNEILDNLGSVEQADNDFDPICLKGKHWAFIKEDLINAIKGFKKY
ncbi:MAG: nucleotidyl transferase AbiEii/AbiGii toxin family protein [Bacteroidetes bacterium]|nr:nucleotidyl transferase AbiEii/AbiGii toxin family protein [Bacteroidota bacterium]